MVVIVQGWGPQYFQVSKIYKMNNNKWIWALLALLIFTGCATTYITSTWKDSGSQPKNYSKLMVVGIMRETDRSLRENMEDHMVSDLKALGYNAYSAYDEYGPKAFQDLNEKQVNQKLRKSGIDGVITIVLLDKQRERHYVPGRIVYSPYIYYHNRFYNYYQAFYNRVEMVGYYEVSTNYFWESNLYDLSADKLVFSVQTESFNPSNLDRLAHEYGEKIIQSMVKGGAISKQSVSPLKAL